MGVFKAQVNFAQPVGIRPRRFRKTLLCKATIVETGTFVTGKRIAFLEGSSPHTEDTVWFIEKTSAKDTSSPHTEDNIIYSCYTDPAVLIVDDDTTRDLFAGEYEQRKAQKDTLAGTPYNHVGHLPTISLLLINRETWEQIGNEIELDDFDGFV